MVTFRKKKNRMVFTGFDEAKAQGTGPLGMEPGRQASRRPGPKTPMSCLGLQTARPVVIASLHIPIYLPAERKEFWRGRFVHNFQWIWVEFATTWVELGGSSAPAATLSLFPQYLGCSQIFTQETSLPKGGHQCCRGLWPTSPSSQTMSDHPSEKGICWVLTSCCYLERQNVLASCQLSKSQLVQQE